MPHIGGDVDLLCLYFSVVAELFLLIVGQFYFFKVRDQFLHLFPYKAKLFAMEMLSVILTPVVLCFSLPPCAPDILEFIRHHTSYVDGVGAVCDYSTFNLNKYGNDEFATNTKESTMLEVRSEKVIPRHKCCKPFFSRLMLVLKMVN